MSGTANGGLDRKWLIENLVVEPLVVDRPVLDVSHVSDSSLRIKMRNRKSIGQRVVEL